MRRRTIDAYQKHERKHNLCLKAFSALAKKKKKKRKEKEKKVLVGDSLRQIKIILRRSSQDAI